MMRMVMATAVLWLGAAVLPVAANTLKDAESPKPEAKTETKAKPNKMIVVADSPAATPQFVNFFFYFNYSILEWWKSGGQNEVRGQWSVFASEHVKAEKRSDLTVLTVMVLNSTEGEEKFVHETKKLLQASVATYVNANVPDKPRATILIVVLAAFPNNMLMTKSRLLILPPEFDLELTGRLAVGAVSGFLVDYSKKSASPPPIKVPPKE